MKKATYIFIVLATAIIGLFCLGCGDVSFPSPYEPDRSIGGTRAQDAYSSVGYLAGGGGCGEGGAVLGLYCVETYEGTTALKMQANGEYETRFSKKLKDCSRQNDFEDYAVTAVGSWERKSHDDGEYLIFKSGEGWAIFSYSANYFGLFLCAPEGYPEEVGLSPGGFSKLY